MCCDAMQVDPSSLASFLQFLQCQLRLEAKERLGEDFHLMDEDATSLWPTYQRWTAPNIGKKDKWVPFHTVFSSHELFVVKDIHHNNTLPWTEKQRFLAMFIFRAHCQPRVFCEAQLPYLLKEKFWENPKDSFADNGAVTQAMLRYRLTTRQPLQTSAFRSIPARLCQNNDENLVINLARRTRLLLDIAEQIWETLQDPSVSGAARFHRLSKTIQTGHGLGETWAKMLMVPIDIAYPQLRLLMDQCNVGVGARQGLQRLLRFSPSQSVQALEAATRALNASSSSCSCSGSGSAGSAGSADRFWELLATVEASARRAFAEYPLVLSQIATPRGGLSAATVQVQLCEWRQFLDFCEKIQRLELSVEAQAAPAFSLRHAMILDDDGDTAETLSSQDTVATAVNGEREFSECLDISEEESHSGTASAPELIPSEGEIPFAKISPEPDFLQAAQVEGPRKVRRLRLRR